MGIDSRRPPLPAPTESMDENDTSGGDTEVATNVTSRTDKTHYTIPEDGRPITISTQKVTAGGKGGGIGKHGRQKSQTSLLIEYFEASKTGDKSRSRPSVRVKVTPSSAKKGRSGGDSVQITSIGGDRKPSYTRRIPLPSGKQSEATELSASSDSNVSAHPPVEIEVLNNSDISRPDRSSRGLMYAPVESNVSSMPPDSMLEGENSVLESDLSYDDTTAAKETAYLRAPRRTGSQSRTNSRDRIAQRVMEKLGATATTPRKSSRSSSRDFEAEGYTRDRRRSSKSQRSEDDAVTGAESSLLSNRSDRSYRSGHSQARSMTNNPKLLEMVEDTIKRMILPEINQMKEDQKIDRKLHKYDDSRSGSMGASSTSLERKVSKSSSTPHLVSRPKVVLNRDGDYPGVVLSRGDSERVKHRRSSREHSDRPSTSRRSSGRHSREGSYESEDKLRKKSSRSTNGLRGAAAAGLAAGGAGGALTSAALRHHDSQGDLSERRKRRSKSKSSRGRSASINDSVEETYTKKEKVPAMPLASAINDSDVTRDSLLSSNNDQPSSRDSAEIRTPIREVSRGSLGDGTSPTSSRTPTRPVSRQDKNLGMSHTNLHLQNSPLNSPARESPASVKSPNGGISNKTRLAALAAAGLGGAAAAKSIDSRHVDADGYGDSAPRRQLSSGSPVQSVSSLRRTFEDSPLIPQGLRPRSAASHSSVDRLRESQKSPSSLRSDSAPTTQRLAQSAKHSRDVSVEGRETPVERNDAAFWREGTGTPGAETADEWLERQHLINDQYRDSLATNRDSYQTNPYPEDAKRFTMYTDDSYLDETGEHDEQGLRDIDGGGLAPNYVHTPVAVESAVASLMEPSTVSSHVISATSSAGKSNGGSYSDRMAAQLKEMGQEKSPIYNGSTMSENIPSQDRWAAIKGHARNLSGQSPAQSPVREQRIDDKPVMTASGLPLAEDPMPEIGHFDSQSDLQTNPSIIQGPLGGDATGKSTWPYTPEPESNRNSTEQKNGLSKGAMLAGAAAGGAAAIAAAHAGRQPKVEDDRDFEIDREATPTGRSFRDEGYATDGRTRSGGGITPKAEVYGKQDLEEYHRAMDAQDLGDDDPFSPASADPRHMRQVSGNSHGMDSPLYDASTGKGMDRIESKDIVALMDHLTVRDAQRNARDTEILVTLVRSAAEMRSSFDEMKKFIAEQDKLIMQNTDRDAELTAQRVLGGPRPQPVPSPRTPRLQVNSEEDIQQKRKGVLSRALKGLTGGKSAKDLARVEEMLMQILDNVEDLKYQQNQGAPLNRSFTADSMDTYENMRATQDSGYEPEGQAGTSSTPSQSGHFPITPREKQQFHSGYDGRRGSDNRVSTVLEESDDELEPHEAHVLNHQFENNERLLTPTQERQRTLGLSPRNTPPQPNVATNNDQTPEKQRKHKSNSSSLFGMSVPKISRWSRTTTSSAAPEPATLDSPKQTQEPKKSFDSSRSSLDDYDDDRSSFRSKDTLPRKQNAGQYAETRSMRSQASSRLTRTPSPLIPSEASAKQHASQGYDPADSPVQEDDEAQFDDPKYQAHRNSLLLQHPQPRQGTTSRHQNTLESQAHSFDDPAGTNSDLSQRTVSDFDPSAWGSSGTAGLARHRLTQVEPLSPVSLNHQEKYGNRKDGSDADPLVPQQKPAVPPKIKYDDPEEWEEPQYSNSGFSKGGYYTSPYGSGHLLEPIEEVRYSLETDSGRNMSPDPQVASAKAVNINSPARKGLTGPRPMGSSRTPSNSNTVKPAADHTPTFSGTVRRKPVPGAQDSRDSLDSETF